MYSIYLFTFPNGKKYCGYTSQKVEKRWNHGRGYQKCPLVWKAIIKYGWDNVKKEVIFTTSNQDLAFQKEREIISTFKLTNPDYGYNIDEGGRPHGSGDRLTEDGRRRIGEACRKHWQDPEYRAKLLEKRRQVIENTPRKSLSEETKKKISQTKKNQHLPAHNRKAVLQLDIKTDKILNEFQSGTDAAKALGKVSQDASNILAVCRGKRKTAYGYKWKFKEEK